MRSLFVEGSSEVGRDDGQSSVGSCSSAGPDEPEIYLMTNFDSDGESDDEALPMHRLRRSIGCCFAIWILVGVVAFQIRWVDEDEELQASSLINSFYVLAQIMTTVGYGDVLLHSQGMKLFMAFYASAGSVLASLVISSQIQSVLEAGQSKVREQMKSVASDEIHKQQHDGPRWYAAAVAGAVYAAFQVAGILFYGFLDTCVCSGHSCTAGDEWWPENCDAHRTFIDAIYLSTVTLTAIGFGDQTPSSRWGRIFGTLWMVFGVAADANFLFETSRFIIASSFASLKDQGMSRKLFHKIDRDGSGTLSRFEFVTYMLVQHGVVQEADIETLLDEFDRFDVDASGELTYADLGYADSQTMPRDSSRDIKALGA